MSLFTRGIGILACIAAWIIVPEERAFHDGKSPPYHDLKDL